MQGEYVSSESELDQPLFSMEVAGQPVQPADQGPILTPEQFTAIFYEGGEAAEKAKAELRAEYEKLQDKLNG